uniref:Uncharacterized protein n=1 Tax=Oncorhynchus kisutch TaxID=8019 RepID=A0A8C7FYU4_ONCKI
MPPPKYFTLNKVSFHNTMPWRPVGVIRVPIIGCARNDVSHWFELKTTFVILTGPMTLGNPGGGIPNMRWGYFAKTSKIRSKTANPSSLSLSLSLSPLCSQVCSEETLNEIPQRSTWKHNCENGILDKDEDFYSGRMDRDLFSQSIGLYSTSIPLNFDLICKDVRKW